MHRVLIVENSTYVTGALKSIARFAKALSNEFEFQWAVTEAIADADLKELIGSDRIHRFKFVEISKKPGRLIMYFPRLIGNALKINRIAKDNNISIIHVNDLYNMTGAAARVLNRDIKIVYHARLLRSSYIGPLYDRFLSMIDRTADALICCSNAVSKDVGDRKVPKTVIYDSEEFDKGDADLPELNAELRNIVYIGNILPGKGQDLAVETIKLLRERGLDVNLRFVGKVDDSEVSRNQKAQLDKMISEAKLEGSVEFAGFRRDVGAEIRKADLVLNLSESESFSMVCLEALKAGVPLVASDSGGPSEIVEHMKSGWLVSNRDVIAAANAIETLAADKDLRKQFSHQALEQAQSKFNVDVNAEQLNDLYRGLIDNTSAAPS
jgi:glycosyltransferase involved in cell wall biosynthesis